MNLDDHVRPITAAIVNEDVEGRMMAIESATRILLAALGYDEMDQHFKRTPERVAKALMEFAAPPSPEQDHEEVLKLLEVAFDDEHDSMVIVGPTNFSSFCAHHMLPFNGRAWVGYIPEDRVCGISKLSRVVHHFARRYTLQERITQQIASAIDEALEPIGVMVVVEAEHGCMHMRGVREASAVTRTSAVRGEFFNDQSARMEFMQLLMLGSNTRG